MGVQFLTEEGERMFNNISSYEKALENIKAEIPPVIPPTELNSEEAELIFVKKEIARLIKNSEMVVQDCNKILSKVKTKEEYAKADAKVAKTIHTNLIARLERILNGNSAFDHQIKLDDED